VKTRADDGIESEAGRLSDNPAFRAARARLAALTLHQKRPNAAREAGRKGGFATAEKHPGGRKAWGLQMAMKRWYNGAPGSRSRAPKAGPGDEGSGIPELGPATARKAKRRGPEKSEGTQLELL
jgi:hypothetical protein